MGRAIAARAALRSLPAAMAIVDRKFESWSGSNLILTYFRATLTTGVAVTCPTPVMTQVNSAAGSAARSAYSAADSARSAYSATFLDANTVG